MPTVKLYGIEVADVRYLFPDWPGTPEQRNSLSYIHTPDQVDGVSVHHDGEVMPPGDMDYNGSTLDEDMERLQAIYNWNYPRLGGFPYQLVPSPHGRLFLCRNLETWGAHTGGENDHLQGMGLMGNYLNSEPPAVQLCAGSLGLIIFWRWRGQLLKAMGHRDWPNQWTECPGTMRSVWIDKMLRFAAFNAPRFPA